MVQQTPVNPARVRQVALLQGLDEAQLQEVCALLQERRYHKGASIFYAGDAGNCLYLITAGRVRMYLASPEGRELTIRIYEPDTSFGELAVLDGGPRSASAYALTDVTTLLLYREDFLQLLRRHFVLVEHVLAQLTAQVRYVDNHLEQLAFLSVPGRVAAVLVQLAGMHSVRAGAMRLELTQQELASFVNTTREWVNRTLNDFADRRLIRLERGAVIVVDRTGLVRWIQ